MPRQILKRIRREADLGSTLSIESSRLRTSNFVTARIKTSTLTVSQESQQSSTPIQLSNSLNLKKYHSTRKIQGTSCLTSLKTTVSSTQDLAATAATETQRTYTISTKSWLILDSSPFISTFTSYRSKSSVYLYQTAVLSSTYTPKTSIIVKLTTSYSDAKSPQTASTRISRASLLNKNVTQKTMVSHRTRPGSSTTGLQLQTSNSYLSTPSLAASVRSTLSLFPLTTSKLSVSIRSVLVTSSFQYASSSIYSTPVPNLYYIEGSVEFDGDCHIYVKNKTLNKDLIREFESYIKKKLPDVNVRFSQNPVRCGSVIIDFGAYSMSEDIESNLKAIFKHSNITVNNQILIVLNITTKLTKPPTSTNTPDVTTKFSTGTTTEPTKKANFTVLYVTVFVIAGIVIIIIIVVIAVSCQRNSSGSFNLSDGKVNYELGAVNGDSKSTINMYGSEPTMQDASGVNENGKINEKHDKTDNSNEYQFGHLPKWELPILELDAPVADTTTKKERSDSCEGIENKGLDIEE